MERIELEQACELALSQQGLLAQSILGFVERQTQIELSLAIARAIVDKSILVAEAGTGTGKTFAYLIPSLLSQKKVIVSTATKTLQDQLFQKDLPTLRKALGIGIQIQNLKGRANYLCRHRIKLYAEQGSFSSLQHLHELSYVREKLEQLKIGERAELPEIAEDSGVWPYVTSTIDNCLGTDCEDYRQCFLVKARQKAMKADLVVINHHLFFADIRLKEEGFGELLPGVDVIIFDEAHHLAEIAATTHGYRLGTRQIRDLMDDVLNEWPILDRASQPLNELSAKLDFVIDKLLSTFDELDENINWESLRKRSEVKNSCQALEEVLADLKKCIELSAHNEHAGLKRCLKRLIELKRILALFMQEKLAYICWLERFKQSLVFHATPYDISKLFQNLLKDLACATIFTSATLTLASSFDCFTQPLGLKEVLKLIFPSPFNYKEQALLYLPRDLPCPKNSEYYPLLVAKMLPIIAALGGRCFFLFTSHKALKQVAKLISSALNYPLLVQGEESKSILLSRFRAYGNAVLLGTASFWEGVDVKGEALSCVIIDKLPFANPKDPVVSGRMSFLEQQGLSSFDSLSLPAAVLALKQGVGRLIRDEKDRGVLIIADPRLTARNYGRQIFASLPPLPKTREEGRVLEFIDGLFKNETASA